MLTPLLPQGLIGGISGPWQIYKMSSSTEAFSCPLFDSNEVLNDSVAIHFDQPLLWSSFGAEVFFKTRSFRSKILAELCQE